MVNMVRYTGHCAENKLLMPPYTLNETTFSLHSYVHCIVCLLLLQVQEA